MVNAKRGLGSPNMNEDTKRDIQSKGGQASPQNFANNPDLAKRAGKKGGQSRAQNQNQQTDTADDQEDIM